MALKELKRLASDENAPLRIGVKRGGCAGMEYILNFEPNEDDECGPLRNRSRNA